MNDTADLLYGLDAIAEYLRVTPRQAKHRADKKKVKNPIPTFKVGKTVCARRASLSAWLEAQEKDGAQ